MHIKFKDKMLLKKILKDNKGKITLERGPLGHFWFDTIDGVALEDLKLPDRFRYEKTLYSDNGGGQFQILNDEYEEQLGRINTECDKKQK